MLVGEPFDGNDAYVLARLTHTRNLVWKFNNLPPARLEEQRVILSQLLGSVGHTCHINQPFRCDYGCNIHVGENFFANFNLTILDEAEVHIGDNAFIGPNVSIYTACHPLDASTRNQGIQWAKSVEIGHNVWIGGNVVILPGVSIGNNVVVGAGSVVTRSIPSGVLAAGNPARVIRSLSTQ